MENTIEIDKKNQVPSLLEDYEEGVLKGFIFISKKWWQFWKPKKVYGDIGIYTKIGSLMRIELNGGYSFTYKDEQNLTSSLT